MTSERDRTILSELALANSDPNIAAHRRRVLEQKEEAIRLMEREVDMNDVEVPIWKLRA